MKNRIDPIEAAATQQRGAFAMDRLPSDRLVAIAREYASRPYLDGSHARENYRDALGFGLAAKCVLMDRIAGTHPAPSISNQ
jgi:hypothetical protein